MALPRARLGDLAAIRDFVARACGELGGDAAARDALVLAADEVCTNVLEHGYAGDGVGPITVVLRREGGDVLLTIADEGRPFDPRRARAPAPDLPWQLRPSGGFGWFLVRQVVDDVRYEGGDAGNVVTLVKRAGSAAPPSPARGGRDAGG
jgi:anti-sigma regulatory factor (Ser/Thr protein kinase)